MSQTNVDSEKKIMVNCISCGLGKTEKSYAIEVYNYNQIPNIGRDLEISVRR